uniref:FYVE-type domain-containing protein n=1 Tax=Steinernema glaseri TaxID=37863 RepID=A0A1I7ZTI0_9BILA
MSDSPPENAVVLESKTNEDEGAALQTCESHTDASPPESPAPAHGDDENCDACPKCESVVVKLRESEANLKEQLAAAQSLSDRYQTELSGERLYRNELETKMRSMSSETDTSIRNATIGHENLLEKFAKLKMDQETYRLEHARAMEYERKVHKKLQSDIRTLSLKYHKLLGANRQTASEMQSQAIELPQDIDQLQYLCLQLREELIETRAAKEHQVNVLQDEVVLLKEQMEEDDRGRKALEKALTARVNDVQGELGIARSQLSTMNDVTQRAEEMDRQSAEFRARITELEAQVKSLQTERAELEKNVTALRMRNSALQGELDTSEAVQKDFVKLSQSLQIQLEKIRAAEQEVRWQFDDDVFHCNGCETPFQSRQRGAKRHCCHCGKVFCPSCVAMTIPSGPQRRPAPVCQVCHTLLNRDSAPFFSHSSGN